jgi:hypothetical protein
VFQRYNLAVWPAQWILATLALVAVSLALSQHRNASRWVSAILALMWFWMAGGYHVAFFAIINRVAIVFAAAFAVQGTLFASMVVRRPGVTYRPRSSAATIIGVVLITYAIVVYPALGYVLGHRYPTAPTFGVPCPTTIFTLGLVVWAGASLPRRLLIVPLAWSVVGTTATIALGMIEDFGLLAAAVATTVTAIVRREHGGAPRLANSTRQARERVCRMSSAPR